MRRGRRLTEEEKEEMRSAMLEDDHDLDSALRAACMHLLCWRDMYEILGPPTPMPENLFMEDARGRAERVVEERARFVKKWAEASREVHRLQCEGVFSLDRDPFDVMPAVRAFAEGAISSGKMRECLRRWLAGATWRGEMREELPPTPDDADGFRVVLVALRKAIGDCDVHDGFCIAHNSSPCALTELLARVDDELSTWTDDDVAALRRRCALSSKEAIALEEERNKWMALWRSSGEAITDLKVQLVCANLAGAFKVWRLVATQVKVHNLDNLVTRPVL